MKMISVTASGLLLLWLASMPAAYADIKIGYVDASRLLEEAPQAEEVSKRLKQEFSGKESAVLADQKELKKLNDQLERDGAVMSETERRKLERDILAKERDIKRERDEFRDDLTQRRDEETGKVLAAMQRAIEVIGKEQNFDLIVYQGVAYASPVINLTDKVLEKLRASAATATPAAPKK